MLACVPSRARRGRSRPENQGLWALALGRRGHLFRNVLAQHPEDVGFGDGQPVVARVLRVLVPVPIFGQDLHLGRQPPDSDVLARASSGARRLYVVVAAGGVERLARPTGGRRGKRVVALGVKKAQVRFARSNRQHDVLDRVEPGQPIRHHVFVACLFQLFHENDGGFRFAQPLRRQLLAFQVPPGPAAVEVLGVLSENGK